MEISWIAGIDNIAYIEYMREKEQEEIQVNENYISSEERPPKTGTKG
jgi:hypothetical protein